ncbi:MAG: hypothetical protein DI584_03145 [Stenotrophomonas sp.]|nr:MAG: hypothetical protein DI584_03145 [Stenotrophomonas sp.]
MPCFAFSARSFGGLSILIGIGSLIRCVCCFASVVAFVQFARRAVIKDALVCLLLAVMFAVYVAWVRSGGRRG